MPSTPVHLLIIDPQNDFCDLPPVAGRPSPTLPVAGADADMQRLAAWIRQHLAHIDAVTVTLDSHQRFDVAHPGFWQDEAGGAVPPFTTITAEQVRAGALLPRRQDARERVLAYLDALQAQGRYRLMVWPEHCLVGSWGHGIHADVLAACGEWQLHHQRAVEPVFKGLNPWTEHYSALQAEVVDPQDPQTQLQTGLLQRLNAAGTLYVAGEASSHCVRSTIEHLLEHIDDATRIVLLTDAMSPVSGFADAQQAFFNHATARGVRLARTDTCVF